MSDDIKLPGPDGWVNRANYYCPANRGCSAPYDGIPKFSANQLRAAVLADRAERASAAEQVCAEVYQVVGSMLEDLGQFGSGRSWKVLDNLNQAKKVHDDVLPWPSFKAKT